MKKLYIFSYGLHPGQVTLETLAAMRQCGAVYTHCLDKATAGQFMKLAPGLKLTPGLNREETARAAVAALGEFDTVGFLTYGNPLFLNQTAAEVMKAAAAKKAAVSVFAGVSSFDALVNLFALNKYSPRGLRLVDAATPADGPFFTPDMDTLVFVPYVLNLPENAGRKKKFIAEALVTYPAAARVFLADCASISSRSSKVEKGKIGGLGALLKKLNERHTMYIPAIRK